MSTLAEIEKALLKLSTDELVRLDDAVETALQTRRRVFTGRDAAGWWRQRAPMPAEDAEAFAADVETARRETNHPPAEPRWE